VCGGAVAGVFAPERIAAQASVDSAAQYAQLPNTEAWSESSWTLLLTVAGIATLATALVARWWFRRRIARLEEENTALLRTQKQLRHDAEHDGLTGLWNHRIIIQRLRGEVDRSRRQAVPLSVILVDLDNFKSVNDTYGHPCGDRVLVEISALLRGMVRSYDWVGRYGGEEFLMILPGSNFVNARKRAEEFRHAVEAAQLTEGKAAIHITGSFGVVSGFPSEHEAMIHAADAALYRAKNNGRNCVIAVEIEPAGESTKEPI
jgi:diguanylate cyclase (GGDEF)-like protein